MNWSDRFVHSSWPTMAIKSRWRERARQVIARILASNPGKSPQELRRLIREAYPFGPRQHHPYRIWCDEVKRAIGPEKAPKQGPLVTLNLYGFVWCRYCTPKPDSRKPAGGCIACFRAEEWNRSLSREQRQWIVAMMATGKDQEFRRAVLRDWLAENGPGGIEV